MISPVLRNIGIKGGKIVRTRLLDHLTIEAVLVGIGFEVRAVAIKHCAIHKARPDTLFDNLVENLLIDVAVIEPSPPVLTDRAGIGYLVGQAKLQKPPIGHIDLDLAHQLPFRANAKQIADKQHLEQQHRIKRRASVVGTIQMRNPVMNETEIDQCVDLAQQMIRRHQR